jgi:hypothetical protein
VAVVGHRKQPEVRGGGDTCAIISAGALDDVDADEKAKCNVRGLVELGAAGLSIDRTVPADSGGLVKAADRGVVGAVLAGLPCCDCDAMRLMAHALCTAVHVRQGIMGIDYSAA